jgi:Mrp family chromosome partitioning ATPase
MAETEAIVKDMQERTNYTSTIASATNPPTNVPGAAPLENPAPEVLDKYRNLNAILATRRAEEQKWMGQLSPSSERVQNLQQQRAAAEADVNKLVANYPGLLGGNTNVAGSPALSLASSANPIDTLHSAETRQHALAARLRELTNQMAQVEAKARELDAAEDAITKAETEKVVADAKYKRFLDSQEQARLDLAFGNRVSNITTAEQPTPGSRDGKKILKMTAGVIGLFFALAFGLPFFIEMVLDQSFKESMDVKARIDAPFYITIPRTNGHHKLAAMQPTKPATMLHGNGAGKPGPGVPDGTVPPSTNAQAALWNGCHELRPFFETLRDRIMTYFEMINLTHKPKLVAVTSCSQGAGVTTTAAGLASSLSEIEEGNILLVNMNIQDGEIHHFYKGKVNCGIEEVLGREKRHQAQVQEHLYVAKETASGNGLPRALPRRFSYLVPLMKASDYDYIIFDMPPMSEISITPRLARFMDMVLLVIESERTSRDAAVRAASLFAESKTNLGLVLNKNRSYLPKRLQNI